MVSYAVIEAPEAVLVGRVWAGLVAVVAVESFEQKAGSARGVLALVSPRHRRREAVHVCVCGVRKKIILKRSTNTINKR